VNVLFLVKDPYLNERFGVMSLAAGLQQAGHQATALDPSRYTLDGLVAAIEALRPGILGYSTETGPHQYYLALNRAIRSRTKILSLMGGPHPTFFPEVLEQDPALDGICRGEGDLVFPELVSKLANGEDYTGTRSFWFRKDGALIKNELAPLVDDLDRLPFPDRAVLADAKAGQAAQAMWSFQTGRGCPFQCSYCFNHSYNALYRGQGRVIRKRSVGSVIAEIAGIRSAHRLSFVTFLDDNFVLGPRGWLEEFADRYPREIGVPFKIALNPSTADERVVPLLARAGCFSVAIGVESGSEEIRRKLLGRNISDDRILGTCRLLRKHGIRIMTQSILGLPVADPYQEDLRTLRLNQRCRPDFAWASLFYPFPKTRLGAVAFSEGYVDDEALPTVRSYLLRSGLRYRSQAERRRVENLHKLFGIAAHYPWLTPIVKGLVRLPLHGPYVVAFFLWYGARYRFVIQRERLTAGSLWRQAAHLRDYLSGLLGRGGGRRSGARA
jgi:anaerobic magnesium-protoporphyrin IX monomethyl ester cyclase